jgi:hypothetical protein
VRINQLKWGDTAGTFSIQKSTTATLSRSSRRTGIPRHGRDRPVSQPQSAQRHRPGIFLDRCDRERPQRDGITERAAEGPNRLGTGNGQSNCAHGDLGISQITVGNASSTPLKDQTLTLALKAQANRDLSKVTPEVHATGDLFTADLNADLNLAAQGGRFAGAETEARDGRSESAVPG